MNSKTIEKMQMFAVFYEGYEWKIIVLLHCQLV